MIGKEILGYHVDDKIGSGGFGTVYKVSKTNASGTYVRALKHITLPTKKQYLSVLNSMGGDYAKADDYFASALKDIVNEIQILSSLSEAGVTNIVRYYENDIIETPSPKTYDIYILMEFLTPLDRYLEKTAFTVRDVIRLGKDILHALISCHEKKIIHRDIKDDNIFVSPDGDFKLGDFGVSKSLKDKSRAESVKGTPNFIAPEVYLGKEKYDNTVDLYSLGIVLYRLLNKSRNPFLPNYPAPYNTDDEDVAFEARMSGKTPELPILAKNQLGEAVLKAIMNRADRYDNATDFLNALLQAEAALNEADLNYIVCEAVEQEMAKVTENKTPSKVSEETIGATYYTDEEVNNGDERDRHLFDTMSSTASSNPTTNEVKETPKSETVHQKSAPIKSNESLPISSEEKGKKKFNTRKWLTFGLPPVFLMLYIGFYMVLIPILYGETLSFFDWLFADVNNIINALQDANNILVPIYVIVLLVILQYVLLGAFITSLYFAAKELHQPKVRKDIGIRYTGKMPQAMLSNIQTMLNEQKLHNLAYDIERISEVIKYSKGFGIDTNVQIVETERAICDIIDTITACATNDNQEQLSAYISELKQKVTMRDALLKK